MCQLAHLAWPVSLDNVSVVVNVWSQPWLAAHRHAIGTVHKGIDQPCSRHRSSSRHRPSSPCRSWATAGAFPGPPRLLRRPQLCRARARDGARSRPRGTVLLPEGRRHTGRRRAVPLPARNQGRASRGRAGGRTGKWRARHPGRAGAGLRLRLCGGPGHDPARPAGGGQEGRPAVGGRQVVRCLRADLGHRARGARSAIRPRGAIWIDVNGERRQTGDLAR